MLAPDEILMPRSVKVKITEKIVWKSQNIQKSTYSNVYWKPQHPKLRVCCWKTLIQTYPIRKCFQWLDNQSTRIADSPETRRGTVSWLLVFAMKDLFSITNVTELGDRYVSAILEYSDRISIESIFHHCLLAIIGALKCFASSKKQT